MEERVNLVPHNLKNFQTLKKKAFKIIVEKGENACNQHFLLFLQCFQSLLKTEIIIIGTFNLLSANVLNLVQSEVYDLEKS